MRLIDADALIAEMHNIILEDGEDRRIFYEVIERQPTIEERKTGEWIPEFDGKFTSGAYWFSCSKCKRVVPEVRNGGWNYCPNCGADMRGGGQDE